MFCVIVNMLFVFLSVVDSSSVKDVAERTIPVSSQSLARSIDSSPVEVKNLYNGKDRQAVGSDSIRPIWYRTDLAYMIYGICFVFFMVGGIRLYSRRLLRANKRLEILVKIRTNELHGSLKQLETVQNHLGEVSHRAGIAEMTTSVLHNVRNVLNSVNASSNFIYDRLHDSKVDKVNKLAELLKSHKEDLYGFLTKDSRGKVITNYLELIGKQLYSERKMILDEVERLQTSIDHIKHIVISQQSIAKASKIEETVSVDELVDTAVNMSEMSVIGHGIKVIKDIDPIHPFKIEKHKVFQMLVNLINNAKHALENTQNQEKLLTIMMKRMDTDRLRIMIKDNGVGIHKENIARMFAYGFTTKQNGNGFGLHASANAATELGGSLTCHSDGPGKGASFYLDLPYSSKSNSAD